MTIYEADHTAQCHLAQTTINQLFIFILFAVYTLYTLLSLLLCNLHLAIILTAPIFSKL
jgi:hypothetical protein